MLFCSAIIEHIYNLRFAISDFRLKSKIANLKSEISLLSALCFMLCALCSLAVFAQEVKAQGEASSAEISEGERNLDEDRQDRAVGERRPRLSQQDGQLRRRQNELRRRIMEQEGISEEDLENPEIRGKLREKIQSMRRESSEDFRPGGDSAARRQMLSPEMLRIMEEEGISREDLRDLEVRRTLRERVESMRSERGRESQQVGESAGESQGMRRGRRGAPVDEAMRRYMVVVEKNLFLQLGSGGEEKKASFALTAVISNTSDRPDNKAIIEKIGGGESYYVSEGDAFADDLEVVDIDDQVVKLDRSGEEMTLKLGEGTEGNRRRGQRGGRRSGTTGGQSRSDEGERSGDDSRQGGSGDFDPGQIPPFARRIMEERGITIDQLRRNPEFRERLRREIGERARRGEGPIRNVIEMRRQGRERRSPR